MKKKTGENGSLFNLDIFNYSNILYKTNCKLKMKQVL